MHGMDTDEELVYWRERAGHAERDAERLRKALEEADFQKAWQEKERRGYQYGEEALSLVEFGFEIALDYLRTLATQKDGGK